MRLFEQVHAVLGDATRVLDTRPEPSPETLRLPASITYEHLPLEASSPGCSGPDDLVVGVARPTGGNGALDTLLSALAPGGRALVLVPGPPEGLPVSTITASLGRCPAQVTAVLPAETTAGYTALLVHRTDGVLTLGSYLGEETAEGGVRHGAEADAPYLRRALNELLLTGFAVRGRARRLREVEAERASLATELEQATRTHERVTDELRTQVAAASAQVDVLRRDARGLQDQLGRLRSSPSFRAGSAIADAARDPLRKGPRLPAVAYRLLREHRLAARGDMVGEDPQRQA
jgi:hypothetical protein